VNILWEVIDGLKKAGEEGEEKEVVGFPECPRNSRAV
jgi:hypothetical protein